MAGLLNRIAKQLLGTQKQVAPKTAYPKTTTIRVKTVEKPSANDWVKNSTISEPVLEETVEAIESIEEMESVVTAIDRTVKRERIKVEVEKEDYLLNQIDEFREKAQQLQDLLLTKESKVLELQNIVDEREVKAKELEHILSERQRKADGITEEVSKQIDSLIEKVSAKMEEIGASIGSDLKDGQKLSEEQIEDLKETLTSLTEQLDTIKGELSEKVHSENVKCYRNVADLFKSMDDKMDAVQKDNEITMIKVASVHKCTIAIIVLTVLNMLGLTAFALYELGVFQLLFG